jgi:hypothetical protein
MLDQIFGALNALVIFSVLSGLLAIAWAVLFVLKRRKAARAIAVLTFLFRIDHSRLFRNLVVYLVRLS